MKNSLEKQTKESKREKTWEEIRKERQEKRQEKRREELSRTLNIPKEQISFTQEEALSGNILYHDGELDLYGLTSAEGLELPDTVNGTLRLDDLTSAEGLKLPHTVGGSLDLGGLTSAEGLELPSTLGGGLDLNNLTTAEGLKFPETIRGRLHLNSLTTLEGITRLPSSVHSVIVSEELSEADIELLDREIKFNTNWYPKIRKCKTWQKKNYRYIETEKSLAPFAERLHRVEQKMDNNEDLDKQDLRTLYAHLVNPHDKPNNHKEENLIGYLQSIREKGGYKSQDLAHLLDIPEDSVLTNKYPRWDRINYDLKKLLMNQNTEIVEEEILRKESRKRYVNVGDFLKSIDDDDAKEVLFGNMLYHDFKVSLSALTSVESLNLKLPRIINSDLYFARLTTTKELELPEIVGGDLCLNSITSAEGLRLPRTVGRDLNLPGLTSAEGLELPENIGRDLNLRSITTPEGLNLPEIVFGCLSLGGLTIAEGLKLPEKIAGFLDLYSLRTVENLKLPDIVGGDVDLSFLHTAENLALPDTVGGELYLNDLTSLEGVTRWPSKVLWNVHVNENLSASERAFLEEKYPGKIRTKYRPEKIEETLAPLTERLQHIEQKMDNNEDLDEQNLRTLYAGFINPLDEPAEESERELIKGLLKRRESEARQDLARVLNISKDRIVLDKEELWLKGIRRSDIMYIHDSIDTRSRSTRALYLPQIVGGNLILDKLPSAEGLKLPDIVSGSLSLSGLTSTEGLKLPHTIGGYLDLGGLTSAEGLELPESVGGNLDLHRLTSIEGITHWPSTLNGSIVVHADLPASEMEFLEEKYPNQIRTARIAAVS